MWKSVAADVKGWQFAVTLFAARNLHAFVIFQREALLCGTLRAFRT